MGSMLSSQMGSVMDENMKKQQDFMMKNQQTMMERNIVMQNEMRERQMAMGIARAREIIKYYAGFYSFVLVGGLAGAMKGRPAAAIPLIPFSFILAFQYDAAYGTLLSRVRDGANSIIKDEHDLLGLPKGLPTFESIEEGRLARKQ
uniref:plasminogen receptor (KT)-like n=1 Tax=Styela clava TaxID=7725 RepID=UPI00193A9A87|nr:plasminogen receptor (KT)-like [Styela clava]